MRQTFALIKPSFAHALSDFFGEHFSLKLCSSPKQKTPAHGRGSGNQVYHKNYTIVLPNFNLANAATNKSVPIVTDELSSAILFQ